MKGTIYNMEEMTDSREIMLTKPHPITIILIYLLFSLVSVGLILCYFGNIDSYVKAEGVVRPKKDVSIIRNKVTGKVSAVYYEEGTSVKEGELLYTLDHEELLNSKSNQIIKLKEVINKLNNLKTLKKSIVEETNYFVGLDKVIDEYLYQYRDYKNNISLNENKIQNDLENIRVLAKENEQLKLLAKSIKENQDFFKDSKSAYALRYTEFLLELKRLQTKLKSYEEDYRAINQLSVNGAYAQSKRDKANEKLLLATLEKEQYINKILLDIEKTIVKNEQMISNTDVEEKQLIMENLKINRIIQLDQDIATTQNEIEELERQIKQIDIGISETKIMSPVRGRVDVNVQLTKGEYIQGGIEIANIIPDGEEQYKILIYVSNKDIASINIEDNVKFHFVALPYKEYGELKGKITRISVDSKKTKTDRLGYYTVEASIENSELKDYNGDKAKIKVGMICEAQIITKSTNILEGILKELNLMN